MREHTITVSIRCFKKLLWFNRGWRVWWWLKHGVNLKTYCLFYKFHALHIAGTLFAIMREGKVSEKLRVYEESSSPRVLMDVMNELNGSRHEMFHQPIGLCGMRIVSTLFTLGGDSVAVEGTSNGKCCCPAVSMSCPQSRPWSSVLAWKWKPRPLCSSACCLH